MHHDSPFLLAATPNRVVTDLRGIPYHAPLERIGFPSFTHTLPVLCSSSAASGHHQPSATLVGPGDAFASKTEMTAQVIPFRLDNLRDPQQQLNHHGAYARRVPKNCLSQRTVRLHARLPACSV